MNILFMGSAAFAIPSLSALSKSGHKVSAVITQPDKPAGRGQKLTSPPAAIAASKLGFELYQPKSIRNEKVLEKIAEFGPDIIVVVAYGKLLPKGLLDMPKYGCINLHPSLLPKYRGAAPIQWTIVNGEKESGVTTMRISEDLDAGDILLQEKTAIQEGETAVTLHDRLAEMGANLVLKTIDGLLKNTVKQIPQEASKVTFAPIIKKEDGLIDWSETALKIKNLILGMQPWPIAYTHLEGKQLKISAATINDHETTARPGTVTIVKNCLIVSTGQGSLSIGELQIEGKRKMNTVDFLNGHKLKSGIILG